MLPQRKNRIKLYRVDTRGGEEEEASPPLVRGLSQERPLILTTEIPLHFFMVMHSLPSISPPTLPDAPSPGLASSSTAAAEALSLLPQVEHLRSLCAPLDREGLREGKC